MAKGLQMGLLLGLEIQDRLRLGLRFKVSLRLRLGLRHRLSLRLRLHLRLSYPGSIGQAA